MIRLLRFGESGAVLVFARTQGESALENEIDFFGIDSWSRVFDEQIDRLSSSWSDERR